MEISLKTIKFTFYIFLYKFLLSCIYIYCITPRYSYLGTDLNFNLFKYITGVFILLLLSPILKDLYVRGKDSDIIVLTLSILYFIPSLNLMGLKNLSTKYIIYLTSYWFLLLIFQKYIIFNIKKLDIISCKNKKILLKILFIVIIINFLFFLKKYSAFRFNFNMDKLVSLRLAARENKLNIFERYLIPNIRLLFPFFNILMLKLKNIKMNVFLIIMQLLLFSYDGKKSVFLNILMVFGSYFFYKNKLFILKSLIFLNFIGLFDYLVLGKYSLNIVNIVQRRLLYVPSLLGSQYFDFIVQEHSPYYLSQSILKIFFKNTEERIPRLIGEIYYGSSVNNANTGLCGDAFINLGWLSLIFYPIALVFIFKVLDLFLVKLDDKMKVFIWFNVAYMFISQSFFTVFFTSGLLSLILFLYLMPNNLQNEIRFFTYKK